MFQQGSPYGFEEQQREKVSKDFSRWIVQGIIGVQDVPESVTKQGLVFLSGFPVTACCMLKQLSVWTLQKEFVPLALMRGQDV